MTSLPELSELRNAPAGDDSEASEILRSETAQRSAAIAVFAGLTANALTAFAIQAWMTYCFAAQVWKLPVPLCVALVVALDVFAMMFMLLTYLLRGTGWPRIAVTAVFFFAVGAQVFAAELFAEHKLWPAEVRWFSALPAVFLALAQEGVILWRTYRDRRKVRTAPADAPAPEPTRDPAPPPVSPAKPRPRPQVKPPASPTKVRGRRADQTIQLAAIKRVRAGERPADVAKEIGKSRRSVEIWVKNAPPETTVNGVKPELTEGVTINGAN